MAGVKSSNLGPADLHRGSDTACDYYAGTKAQLVASGLCKAEWFPTKLIPEFCKDGRPKLGNGGRQRFKRVYEVEGSNPAITLTHRIDADKREYWWVRIDTTDAEQEKREAVENAKLDEQRRELEEAQRQRAAASAAASPIVLRLRARYPGILISGSVSKHEDGLFQSLSFQAEDLEVLQRLGLVTSEMLDKIHDQQGWYSGKLRDGRSFFVRQGNDYCDITLHTSEFPRERKNFPVTEARRVLKMIAARTT